MHDLVISIEDRELFFIKTNSKTIEADYLIIATGVKDITPNIPGYSECWGISVIHCPYCHGYEVKYQKTGIIGNGDVAFHYSKLLSNLSKELVIFTNGKATFTKEQEEKLARYNIEIIETEIEEITHQNGQITSLKLKDNSNYFIEVVYASFGITQKTDFATKLGCEMTEKGLIKVDSTQKTTVAKVFACGDNSSPFRSLANAVSSGNIAGMNLNNLIIEYNF